MVKAFRELYKEATRRQVSYRCAAYIIAIERIAAVYRYRGIFP